MKKERINKTSYIIVRVKPIEKEYLIKSAQTRKQKFSNFIRFLLGL